MFYTSIKNFNYDALLDLSDSDSVSTAGVAYLLGVSVSNVLVMVKAGQFPQPAFKKPIAWTKSQLLIEFYRRNALIAKLDRLDKEYAFYSNREHLATTAPPTDKCTCYCGECGLATTQE